jgi:hypothetical protein
VGVVKVPIVKPPVVVPPPYLGWQSVPPDLPWAGRFWVASGVVPVPIVKPAPLRLVVEAAAWAVPPQGLALSVVGVMPNFPTSPVIPTPLGDVYAPIVNLTGQLVSGATKAAPASTTTVVTIS